MVGAGVVGAAVALALSRRGASVVLLEAEEAPGLAASGTNSGILHTGFDSLPGELETELILRAAQLRDAVIDSLSLPLLRCGALLAPLQESQRETIAGLAATARANRVDAELRADGALAIPGEAVTDPVAFTLALAAGAVRHGARLRTRFRVAAIEPDAVRGEAGERLACRMVVNCAGLYADEVARLAGDASFEIYPRKGEFLVFEPPPGERLAHILLPVPTRRTKGVLVFPTIDGKVVAGPTAVDGTDKRDWSVRPEARSEILANAVPMWPPLAQATPLAAYVGLRPAGRGVNYLIGRSPACDRLLNVAAIRSTGLTASLGIAERVCAIVESAGVALAPEQPLRPRAPAQPAGPWWRRTAEHVAR